MYTEEQFESALLNLNVVIDELFMKGKYINKAKGKIEGKAYLWNKEGNCQNIKGDRIFEYDLKLM